MAVAAVVVRATGRGLARWSKFTFSVTHVHVIFVVCKHVLPLL
jgi:hypothetical protein